MPETQGGRFCELAGSVQGDPQADVRASGQEHWL